MPDLDRLEPLGLSPTPLLGQRESQQTTQYTCRGRKLQAKGGSGPAEHTPIKQGTKKACAERLSTSRGEGLAAKQILAGSWPGRPPSLVSWADFTTPSRSRNRQGNLEALSAMKHSKSTGTRWARKVQEREMAEAIRYGGVSPSSQFRQLRANPGLEHLDNRNDIAHEA